MAGWAGSWGGLGAQGAEYKRSGGRSVSSPVKMVTGSRKQGLAPKKTQNGRRFRESFALTGSNLPMKGSSKDRRARVGEGLGACPVPLDPAGAVRISRPICGPKSAKKGPLLRVSQGGQSMD